MWRRPLEWNLNGTTDPRDGSVDNLSQNSLKDHHGPIRAPKSRSAAPPVRLTEYGNLPSDAPPGAYFRDDGAVMIDIALLPCRHGVIFSFTPTPEQLADARKRSRYLCIWDGQPLEPIEPIAPISNCYINRRYKEYETDIEEQIKEIKKAAKSEKCTIGIDEINVIDERAFPNSGNHRSMTEVTTDLKPLESEVDRDDYEYTTYTSPFDR